MMEPWECPKMTKGRVLSGQFSRKYCRIKHINQRQERGGGSSQMVWVMVDGRRYTVKASSTQVTVCSICSMNCFSFFSARPGEKVNSNGGIWQRRAERRNKARNVPQQRVRDLAWGSLGSAFQAGCTVEPTSYKSLPCIWPVQQVLSAKQSKRYAGKVPGYPLDPGYPRPCQ